MNFDLIVSGGTVATDTDVSTVDIGVTDGRVAALMESAERAGATAARWLDATGHLVVPGGIDPHVHCDLPVPASSAGEAAITDGPDVVSRAAAYGGTTSLIDFAMVGEDEDIPQALRRTEDRWAGTSYCDYSFHIMLRGAVDDRTLAQIQQAVAAGYQSLKVFTTNIRPSVQGVMVPFGRIQDVFAAARDAGAVVALHAEDNDIVMHEYERHLAAGKVALTYMPDVHSALSEAAAFARLISLADGLGGPDLYFMHVSSAAGVDAIERARARGMRVYGETLPQYALHTAADYAEPDGMKYHTYPSLRHDEDTRRFWAGFSSGALSVFATDELCTSYAVKTRGDRIDNATGGNSGIEPRMALLYTEMVVRRGMSVSAFVSATSTSAAKIFGMYPRKGTIRVGSDADLVVLDTTRSLTVTAGMLHETDYTPWEGWPVEAWPVTTVRRGEVLVEGQRFGGTPSGQVIRRDRVPSAR